MKKNSIKYGYVAFQIHPAPERNKAAYTKEEKTRKVFSEDTDHGEPRRQFGMHPAV